MTQKELDTMEIPYHFRNITFENCKIDGKDLRYSSFINCTFLGCTICNNDLNYVNFFGSVFNNTSFSQNSTFYTIFNFTTWVKNSTIDSVNKTAFSEGIMGDTIIFKAFNKYNTPPEKGSYTGFKVAELQKGKYVIVELKITKDSKRSSAASRKCRASKAKVKAFYDLETKFKFEDQKAIAHSIYDENFEYKVGEVVEVKDFDENRWNECTRGIHHFLSFDEAVEYSKTQVIMSNLTDLNSCSTVGYYHPVGSCCCTQTATTRF